MMLFFYSVLLSLLLTLPNISLAADKYVAVTGNDTTGDGSIGNPWANPQKCVGNINPGDTCWVGSGTYTDLDGNGVVLYITGATGAIDGAAGNPITIKSITPLGAKLRMPAPTTINSYGVRACRPYYTIEGFDITDDGIPTTQGASAGMTAMSFCESGNSTGVIFRRNNIHDVGRAICSNSNVGNAGIGGKPGTDAIVEYNNIQRVGRLRNVESGCSTSLFQNDHGLYVWSTNNFTVHHNQFDENISGYDIQNYAPSQISTGFNVYNNTFNKSTLTGSAPTACVLLSYTNTDALFKNNIFRNCPSGYAVTWFAPGVQTNVVMSFNLSDSADPDLNNPSKPSSGVTTSNNIVGSSSINFTNVGSHVLTLAAGSAAIDAGTNVGYACNGTCDIGAFETFTFSSCQVPNGAANTIQATFTNNAFPPIQTVTTFTARRNGSNNALTGAATIIGDNIASFPLTATYVGGDTADLSWSSGGLTDSARIGGSINQPFIQTLTNQSCTNNASAPVAYLLTQARFQYRGVYGPENTLDIRGVENQNPFYVIKNGAVRIRFAVTDSTVNAPSFGLQLRYSRNGGGYATVPSSFNADGIQMCESRYPNLGVTSGGFTTNQLSTGGTFVPGAVLLTSAATPTITGLNIGFKTEMEYCVTWNSSASGVFVFRLYEQNGTALGAYTSGAEPTVTIMSSTASGGP